MIDCEKCKYYHDNCDARFRCRIDIEKIRADAIDEIIKHFEEHHIVVFDKFEIVDELEELKEQRDDS